MPGQTFKTVYYLQFLPALLPTPHPLAGKEFLRTEEGNDNSLCLNSTLTTESTRGSLAEYQVPGWRGSPDRCPLRGTFPHFPPPLHFPHPRTGRAEAGNPEWIRGGERSAKRTGRRLERGSGQKARRARVGTKKPAQKREGGRLEARDGAPPRKSPASAGGQPDPLTVGRRSSAMWEGSGRNAGPAQGGTRTGEEGHRLPRRR